MLIFLQLAPGQLMNPTECFALFNGVAILVSLSPPLPWRKVVFLPGISPVNTINAIAHERGNLMRDSEIN